MGRGRGAAVRLLSVPDGRRKESFDMILDVTEVAFSRSAARKVLPSRLTHIYLAKLTTTGSIVGSNSIHRNGASWL